MKLISTTVTDPWGLEVIYALKNGRNKDEAVFMQEVAEGKITVYFHVNRESVWAGMLEAMVLMYFERYENHLGRHSRPEGTFYYVYNNLAVTDAQHFKRVFTHWSGGRTSIDFYKDLLINKTT